MSVRGWSISLAVLAALSIGATAARADQHDAGLEATLRGVLEKNIDAYERKDAEATAKTVHTKSPAYEASKEAAGELKDLDVDAEIVAFKYMGHDDEFAVARAKTKTSKKAGETEDFTDNTVDVIILFHMEDGVWKLWSEQVLDIDVPAE